MCRRCWKREVTDKFARHGWDVDAYVKRVEAELMFPPRKPKDGRR